MTSRFSEGQLVQTPFGKGVVRELRNNHRLLIEVQGRALVVSDAEVTAVDATRQRGRSREVEAAPSRASTDGRAGPFGPAEIDLHGLTVEEALARTESALNEALLADAEVLRLIHGRSGGRIRAAVHRLLSELPGVRGFRIDPRNQGVTIVTL